MNSRANQRVPARRASLIASIALPVLLFASGRGAGAAEPIAIQPPARESGWAFQVAPYGWALGLDGTLITRGADLPISEAFGDLASQLRFAVMLEAEVRKDRFGLFANILGAKLKDDATVLRRDVDFTLQMWTTQFGLDYRLGPYPLGGSPDSSQVTIEPLVGGRYFYLDTTIAITGLPTLQGSRDWMDPILGVRTTWDLTRHWNIYVTGNAGGFGVGTELSWEALGTIGYRFHFSRKVTGNVLLGYRALYQDYKSGSGTSLFEFDATMHGPILGLAVDF